MIKETEAVDLPSPTEALSWWVRNKNKMCGAILLLIGFFGGNVDRITEIARDLVPDLSGNTQDKQGDGDVQSAPYYPEPEPEPQIPAPVNISDTILEDMKNKVDNNSDNINELQMKQQTLIDDIGDFGKKVEDLKGKVELLDVDEDDNNGQIPIE